MSKFKNAVIEVVKKIPKGKIVSYGQVALYIGVPRAARQVGWILNGLDDGLLVPWWRVVNNKGRISIKGSKYSALDQKKLLESEGVVVDDELHMEIENYRFKPNKEFINKLGLDPVYLEMIASKLPYTTNH
jgi:methylated-DNA-protein-cysteine methyltransferase related protein